MTKQTPLFSNELALFSMHLCTTEEYLSLALPYYTHKQILIDSFVDDFIHASTQYSIDYQGKAVGFFAIEGGERLASFGLLSGYHRYAQDIFSHVKKTENILGAMVSTSDELFLSLSMDNYQTISNQAYFFRYLPNDTLGDLSPLVLKKANLVKDMPALVVAGEFLKSKIEKIDDGNKRLTLYLAYLQDTLVGYGNIEYSEFTPFASIGMMVVPEHRQQGYARHILELLQKEVLANGVEPISGCWYYNHSSKKSIEHAGGQCQTRLLKFIF